MLAKRGIWVKGWRALSFGPPHARWHLKVSQAVKSPLSRSALPFSASSHPSPLPNPARVVTPCLPHSHPFFSDNPTYFPVSPLDPQDFTLPNRPLTLRIPLLFWWWGIPVEGKQEGKAKQTATQQQDRSETPTVGVGEALFFKRWHYHTLITTF